jgi:hypothetical protein
MISLMHDVIPGGPQPQLAMAFQIRVSMDCAPVPGLGTAYQNDYRTGMSLPMAQWAAPGGVGSTSALPPATARVTTWSALRLRHLPDTGRVLGVAATLVSLQMLLLTAFRWPTS